MRDYIVTEIEFEKHKYLAAALYDGMRLMFLRLSDETSASLVGRIYQASVDSRAKNIGGAFVSIGKNTLCFLPSVTKNMNLSGKIPVQITKDASGMKEPVVSAHLRIAGKNAVMTEGRGGLSFSSKLSDEDKILLKKWLADSEFPGCRPLLRTNAVKAEKAELLSELASLYDLYQSVLRKAECADSGKLLYEPEPFYIEELRDLYSPPERVFSDIPKIAEELEPFAPNQTEQILIKNRSLSLPELYDLRHDIERLTNKKVWLKCGGFLVIEKTEAFISIDVNTGKCAKGKIPEETYRKVNLEAAEEIVRQLSLRNLSGIILIDFINLDHPDHREELLNVMKKMARKERHLLEIVDLTPLGIMEAIRQRKDRPLEEVLKSSCQA